MTTKEEEKVVLGGGIWDLYRKMCTRRKVSVNLDESDTEKQLDFIQETLVFYKEVCTIASAHKPWNLDNVDYVCMFVLMLYGINVLLFLYQGS